jgi:hypothetical protein
VYVHVRVPVAENLEVEVDRFIHTLDRASGRHHVGPELAALIGAHRLRVADVARAEYHD